MNLTVSTVLKPYDIYNVIGTIQGTVEPGKMHTYFGCVFVYYELSIVRRKDSAIRPIQRIHPYTLGCNKSYVAVHTFVRLWCVLGYMGMPHGEKAL